MGWRHFAIGITRDLLKSGVFPLTGRGFRFLTLTRWNEDRPRTFTASWKIEEHFIQVVREDRILRFHPEELELARAGDELVLWWNSDLPKGTAELQDGATIMVRHFLQRADEAFIVVLLEHGIPSGDELVGPTHDRAGWEALRQRALDLVLEAEARGIASLVAADRFMAEQGAILELHGAQESIEARVLANNLLDVRRGRSPRGRKRRPDYEPNRDAASLLRVLESAVDVFGRTGEDVPRPVAATSLLRQILEGSTER